MTVMVPTMIGMLLNHEAFRPERLASLRTLTYGASPMPAALLDRLLDRVPDLDIFQGYGMTESSAVLTVLGPEEHRAGGAVPALGRAARCRAWCCRSRTPTASPCPTGDDRRGLRARRQLHARVLEPARRDRRRVPRRLVPHRRRGLPRRARAISSSSTA